MSCGNICGGHRDNCACSERSVETAGYERQRRCRGQGTSDAAQALLCLIGGPDGGEGTGGC